MFLGLTRTSEPSEPAVSVADVKAVLLITDSDSDSRLSDLVNAVERWLEETANVSLISQDWRVSFDAVPSDRCFRIPRPPLLSVSALDYRDPDDGTWSTVSSSDYDVLVDANPGRMVVNSGAMPTVHGTLKEKFRVSFTSGMAATTVALKASRPDVTELLARTVAEMYDECIEAGEGYFAKQLLPALHVSGRTLEMAVA